MQYNKPAGRNPYKGNTYRGNTEGAKELQRGKKVDLRNFKVDLVTGTLVSQGCASPSSQQEFLPVSELV